MSRYDETNVENMAKDILKGLNEYVTLASSEVKKAVRKTATFVRNETSKNAKTRFEGTGDYAKSWATRKLKETSNSLESVVYSKLYPLTHLLEDGHKLIGHKPEKRDLGKYAQGKQHIETARNKGEKYLDELLKKALKK